MPTTTNWRAAHENDSFGRHPARRLRMHRESLRVAVALLLAPRVVGAQQAAPDITPVAPSIIREYRIPVDITGMLAELGVPVLAQLPYIEIRSGTIEPRSGGLWVVFAVEPSLPPMRIDRRTGAAKVIHGIAGAPTRYRRVMTILPGAHGDVGVWDRGSLSMIWIDSSGTQARTWAVPQGGASDFRHTYTDADGRFLLGYAGRLCTYNAPFLARVDSARGLVDTVLVPAPPDPGSVWGSVTRHPSGAEAGSCGGRSPLWAVDARGRINVARRDSNFVLVMDRKAERRAFVPHYHEPLTAGEIADARTLTANLDRSRRAQGGDLVGTPPPDPTHRAQIDELIPDLNGGIVVKRARLCTSVPEWPTPSRSAPARNTNDTCTIFERFDPDGRRLTPFTIAHDDRLLAVRGDTVWLSREGPGRATLVVEAIVRNR
jgi:hypothetical protein